MNIGCRQVDAGTDPIRFLFKSLLVRGLGFLKSPCLEIGHSHDLIVKGLHLIFGNRTEQLDRPVELFCIQVKVSQIVQDLWGLRLHLPRFEEVLLGNCREAALLIVKGEFLFHDRAARLFLLEGEQFSFGFGIIFVNGVESCLQKPGRNILRLNLQCFSYLFQRIGDPALVQEKRGKRDPCRNMVCVPL